MCTNNWPLLLDLSRDECKRILRRLELEAYSAVLTAFRAQGDLSREKKGILQELQNILSISTERHRAEVRRAVNDEKLTTIADNMAGPDVSSEWQIEGRRLIPLMPRLVPQTAFTVTANNAASMQAEKNMSLPPPSQTGSKEVVPTTPTTPSSAAAVPATAPKAGRPTSPASNVVVLPSGMSIHIKGGLNTEEEDVQSKRRPRRSSSTEAAVITKTTQAQVPAVTSKPTLATAGPGPTTVSPMKITFTKSPAKPQTTTVTPSQKVILVSTTTHSGSSPTIIQKSMAVPVIKTTTTTGGTVTTFTSPRASIIMPSSMASSVANGNLGSIVTVATTSSTGGPRSSSAVTALTTANPTLLASSLNAVRPRTKMITTRPKAPMMSPRTGMVMQMGGSHLSGSPMAHGTQGLHNIHVKPVHTKPTIHIKHEGGMKIITQGMPSSASKILPKPPGSGQGSPMVVMSSAQPSITMVSKSNASLAGQMAGGRVLNISTQGGKVIASSSNRGTAANVVTVNPKTLQLTAIKGAGGTTVLTTSGRVATATGAKPNVIVVQKAQPKRCPTSTTSTITFPRPSTSSSNSPFEKELVSYIQKQDSIKHLPGSKTIVTKQTTTKMTTEPQVKRQPQPFAVKVRSDGGAGGVSSSGGGEGGRSSLLAELIQAVGIQPDSTGDVAATAAAAGGDQDATPGVHHVVVQQEEVVMTTNQTVVTVPAPTTSKEVGGNRWVEYDMPRDTQTLLSAGRDSSDTSAIKALLDLQTGAKQQPRPKPVTNLDLSQVRVQQQERYSVGQSTSISRTASTSTTPSSSRPIQLTTRTHSAEPMTTNVVLEQPDGETVAVQLAGADLAHLTSMGQEIIGELDPETGIFYTTAPGGGETPVTVVTSTHQIVQQPVTQQIVQQPVTQQIVHQPVTQQIIQQPVTQQVVQQPVTQQVIQQPVIQQPVTQQIMQQPVTQQIIQQPMTQQIIPSQTMSTVKATTTLSPAAKPIDFLSSALTQAQIDLDPYQFIEEDEPAFGAKIPATTATTASSSESSAEQPPQGPLMQIMTPDSTVDVTAEQSVQSQELNLNLSADSSTVDNAATAVSVSLNPQSLEQGVTLSKETLSDQSLPQHAQRSQQSQPQAAPVQSQVSALQTASRPVDSTAQAAHQSVSTVQAMRPISSAVQMSRPNVATLQVSRAGISTVQMSRPSVSSVQVSRPTAATGQVSRSGVTTVQLTRPSISTLQGTRPVVSTVQVTRPVASTVQGTRPVASTVQVPHPVASSTVQGRPPVVPTEQVTRPSTFTVQGSSLPLSVASTVQATQPLVSTIQTAPTVSVVSTTETAAVTVAATETPTVGLSSLGTTVVPTIESTEPTISTLVPPVIADVPTSNTEGDTINAGPTLEHQGGEILEEMVVSDGIIDFEQHEVCVPDTASNVTVAVEPGGLDTTTMLIEDFTSQQFITDSGPSGRSAGELITIEYPSQGEGSNLMDPGPTSPTPVAGTSECQSSSGGEGGDPGVSSPVRSSQRKRRPPSMPDDSPPHGHGNMSSWVRHASSLLQKVCKYRGSRKEKGELNASAWFLAPVDPKEVPDYYEIIQKPMDFGTIRHKLETSQYNSWEDFHMDMLLVQENCRRYNPPGHEIRRDCDEVFSFYTLEYEWGKDKWQKMHNSSPSPKKPRLDRSPMKT